MLGHPLAQLVPAGVGEAIRAALEGKGVVWHLGRKVVAINTAGSGIRADLDDDSVIEADAVLSTVGLRPHTRLSAEAGLAIGRGIKVDATGRTSDPFIYALCACDESQRGLAASVPPIMEATRALRPSALGKPT